MSESLSTLSLWDLAEELAGLGAQATKLRTGGWIHRLVSRHVDKVEADELKVMTEITSRFGGVIRAIYLEVVPNALASSIDDFSDFSREIWHMCADDLVPNQAGERISSVLWREITRACETLAPSAEVARMDQFKRKVMLRQFIDEMENCQERGHLQWQYRSNGAGEEDLGQVVDALAPACAKLHTEVLRHSSRLRVLTDGAISMEDFGKSGIEHSYVKWMLGLS